MEMDCRKIDDRSYEVAVHDCFVSNNVMKAGIAEHVRVRGLRPALRLAQDDGLAPFRTIGIDDDMCAGPGRGVPPGADTRKGGVVVDQSLIASFTPLRQAVRRFVTEEVLPLAR